MKHKTTVTRTPDPYCGYTYLVTCLGCSYGREYLYHDEAHLAGRDHESNADYYTLKSPERAL